MKKSLFLFLLGVNLFATKLLDTNIYTHNRYIDLEFSLSDPYTKKAIISKKDDTHYIFFDAITVEKAKEISKENRYYRFTRIFPEKGGLLIKIKEKKEALSIDVAQSKDGYTLKLKVKNRGKYQLGEYKVPAKVGEEVPQLERKYLISMGFVALLLLIWILIKLATNKKNGQNFFIKSGKSSLKIEVEVQKIIDNQNKIVQIKMAGVNYIVLVGQNNMLLDKFPDVTSKPISKFDADLLKSQKKLNSLIK